MSFAPAHSSQAPQHSERSWKNYSLQFPVIDKILRRAHGQDIPDREFDFGGATDSEDDSLPPSKNRGRGVYASGDLNRKLEWTMKNEGSGLESSDEDEGDIGRSGDNYTMTELRIMAKWISRHTTTEWAEKSPTQRWEAATQLVSCIEKGLFWRKRLERLEVTPDFIGCLASYEDPEISENTIQ